MPSTARSCASSTAPTAGGPRTNWHSDVTWRERPSLGSILRAVEVPEVGGDTLFADMYVAYDGLSPEMQRFVCGLTAGARHSARVFASKLGKKAEELHEKYPPRRAPGPCAPIPRPGVGWLYVNVGFTDRILGLTAKESDWLLDHLYATAKNADLQCPLPLGSWLARVLGQPLVPALRGERLLPSPVG